MPGGHRDDEQRGARREGDLRRDVLRRGADLPERPARRRVVDVEGVDERLRPLVDRAVEDLAGRLGVERSTVTVEAAGSVTWSDQSCGCPEPGRSYAQVPVDGAYVRLSSGGQVFHYHHGGRRGLFTCEN
jgi:hypothetical protein